MGQLLFQSFVRARFTAGSTLFSDLLDIIEQRHEAEVHVKLLMAVEQGQTRIVSNEIHFCFLVASQHENVF